jgi:5-methylcytosine-specific restriction endonuclease McrA
MSENNDELQQDALQQEDASISDGLLDNFFVPADDEHIAREKRKAMELRQSQWWKNELAKGKCHYCGRRFHPSQLTMDHIVPIVRGGFTRKQNVVTCCKECNSKKKYLLPVEWQEYLEKLKQDSSK